MGNDGRRSVTPPLSHRPFMALLTERETTTELTTAPQVEPKRRRKVVPSWQSQGSDAVMPGAEAEARLELVVEEEVAPPVQCESPVQLELPVVMARLEADVVAVEDLEKKEDSMPKKTKELNDVDRKAIVERANAAAAASRAGESFETYAQIGKDYGIKAQAVANLVSRWRRRAKVAKKGGKTVEKVEKVPERSMRAAKPPGLALRFDRAVEVTIVGLDEYIDAKLNRLADEVISAKVKRAIATALKEGIG